jgi:ATP-dependent RNA helicase DeaD
LRRSRRTRTKSQVNEKQGVSEEDAQKSSLEPESILEPENALPEVSLEDLPESIREAVTRGGWKELLPVQSKTIPYLLAGRDLMVQARTGSGKTGAFVLPILDKIDTGQAACQALVLAPTRELALQVATEASRIAPKNVNVAVVYGGVRYGPQIEAFRKGAHIVVGTPGRILDHLLKGTLTLNDMRILVFDEADRLLSMGFYPDMKELKKYLPKRGLSAYMFSATFPPHVFNLAREFLRQPDFLSLSRDHIHVSETEHIYYAVHAMEKDRSLVRIIEMENPESAIIFCNTKQSVHYVSAVLQRFGYDADELTADLSQAARERVLGRVRSHTLRFLVATDLAARGIDISELSHVIQYEPPQEMELYIHRAGRTGRVGATGVAISLVSALEELELKRIAKRYEINLHQRPLPTQEDVETIVADRVTAILEAQMRDRDKLQSERMQRFVPLAQNLAESESELSLITMLLDDFYQRTLHAPPPQPPGSEPQQKQPRSQRRSSRSSSKRGGSRGGRRRK